MCAAFAVEAGPELRVYGFIARDEHANGAVVQVDVYLINNGKSEILIPLGPILKKAYTPDGLTLVAGLQRTPDGCLVKPSAGMMDLTTVKTGELVFLAQARWKLEQDTRRVYPVVCEIRSALSGMYPGIWCGVLTGQIDLSQLGPSPKGPSQKGTRLNN